MTRKRVLVVGETGAGKSSVIKQQTGNNNIKTSDSAKGCTFHTQIYEHGDVVFMDTVGLGEGSNGTLKNVDAVKKLVSFIKTNQAGFSLLIFVKRKGRITRFDEDNYKLFYEVMCKRKVKAILVLTNCELVKPMDKWWHQNKENFENQGLIFSDCVSVCAADDSSLLDMDDHMRKAFVELRKESKIAVSNAIMKNSLEKPVALYTKSWRGIFKWGLFKSVYRFLAIRFGFSINWTLNSLEKLLINLGLEPKEAIEYAKK